jgi:hypothetical protein
VHPRSGIGLRNVRRGHTGIEQLLYPLAGTAAGRGTLFLDGLPAMRRKRWGGGVGSWFLPFLDAMVDGPVLGKDGSIRDRHRLEQNAVWYGFGFEIIPFV